MLSPRWRRSSAVATSILLVPILACSGGLDSSTHPGGAGPDLSGVDDVNEFDRALRMYSGPFTIVTDGFAGARGEVTRTFDGTAFSFSWGVPSPVEEQRLFPDGGDPGPVCYQLTQGEWVREPTSDSPSDPGRSFAALIADELVTGPGVLESTETGFEYRGASGATAPADARIEIDIEAGRMDEARVYRDTTLVRTDRFGYSAPRIDRPRDAADGMDVTC